MQKIVTPSGETLVVMPLADYEELLDAADIAAADKIMADIEAGRSELVPASVVDRIIDGENRIRVWREHRGLSATDLATKAEISAGYLSELETGKKTGTVETLKKIATVLNLDIDDLVP
ncbi:MAG: helix-turn-helix transcriptional regulator [Devosia nanyangense]|uniref:Helix-turn-helix transcriptional regulator n=1 Tax=Devosia nanyangense TaxID=1228055 RepID=A0A933L4A1_9HYPH|nr:helix-turn-helix transcriptional regulator [Devosia nanyangense]